ncbi:hypothetical protein HNQ77_002267 [Silvibacterium bohemicum]|uniref:Uncharacterized protein n=1 Tax=Silvibacterium bohemicum TaxID=1577686 RepID=A0A841JUW2_9BACT|nr:hypothetical protein [Silvibacterium bohemicum]MBB6144315.1 hypothetical protein [Silvibacterium bohemicum]
MLFDLAQYRKPLPVDVQVFASGANRESEIRGFALLGIPVGVSASHLNDAAVSTLIEMNQPVMIDSGAFSEVRITERGPDTVAPIDEIEWHRRLDVYMRLASALGRLAIVVAPDKVGDQQETLARLARYRKELAIIASKGATILLPLQVGAMSHGTFLDAAEASAGVSLTPAMPMRKAATSDVALLSFIEDARPRHVHLLGIGIGTRRAERLIEAIRYFSPSTRITMDSNRLRAVVGNRRPLTQVERQLRRSEPECIYRAVDSPVLALMGETLDYTDLIASPSLWATTEQLRGITRAAQLRTGETALFIETPDDFLQSPCRNSDGLTWIEHPVMAFELDRAWHQYVDLRHSSNVRSAAIASVFADSPICGQALPVFVS